MRGRILVLVAYLAVFSRPLKAFSTLFENPYAIPTTERVLLTPLDPLRSQSVRGLSDEALRILANRKDQSVLKYLVRMIRYCKRYHHQELKWYYQQGWELVAVKIFGPLPPRPEYNLKGLNEDPAYQHPVNAFHATPDPPHIPGLLISKPLRRIVRRFTAPYKSWHITYETLECGHILVAPSGYSVPVKSRRCFHCGYEKALARKKPVRATADRGKAVSA